MCEFQFIFPLLGIKIAQDKPKEPKEKESKIVSYCLNRLDEPILIAEPKPLLTEFNIQHRLDSCGG